MILVQRRRNQKLQILTISALLLLAKEVQGLDTESDTDWLLRHCTEGGIEKETVCLTEKQNPVSCLPIGNVGNCEKASSSFSHVKTLQISSLTKEQFAVDENREYMCFKPEISSSGTGEMMGVDIQMERLETNRLHGTVFKFGCIYPKGLERTKHATMPYCCERLPQAFFEDEVRISASAHSLPVMPALMPEHGTFQVKDLITLNLRNYQTNYVNVLLPNINLEPTKEKWKFPFLKYIFIGLGVTAFLGILITLFLIWKCCRGKTGRLEGQGNNQVPEMFSKHISPPASVNLYHYNGHLPLSDVTSLENNV